MSSQLNIAPSPGSPTGEGPGPDLPKAYGVTRLVLLPRDPGWLHAYWEVAGSTWAEVEGLFGPGARDAGRPALRFRSESDGASFDVDVDLASRGWYVRMPGEPGPWKARLGLRLPDGRFAPLAISETVQMPAGRVSREADAKWAALKSEWQKVFELSGAGRLAAGSLDLARAMAQHWEFMGAGSSQMAPPTGLASPPDAAEQEKEYEKSR